MPIDFDIAAAERTREAHALFDSLPSQGHSSLVTLNGAELCILGGPGHQAFWKPLATIWLDASPESRDRLTEACTDMMIERGLLIREDAGQGYSPDARFALSPELGITLAARSRPAFIVTTYHTANLPPVCLFAIGDETSPVRGIVAEIPDIVPGTKEHAERMGPVGMLFYYTLHTPESAAEFLADWTLRPAPVKRFRKQPSRLVDLYRAGGGPTLTARLSVLGDGTTAHVTGPGVDGEYGKDTLQAVMLDLFTRGAHPA